MSAYIVDKIHVDALVQAAVDRDASYYFDGRWTRVRQDRARVGQMLTDANVASVGYRYPSDTLTDLPGRVDSWWVIPYRNPPEQS